MFVPAAAVSITGKIQPSLLARMLGSDDRESGFRNRWVFAMPPAAEIVIDTEARTGDRRLFQQLVDAVPAVNLRGPGTPDCVPTPEGQASFAQDRRTAA